MNILHIVVSGQRHYQKSLSINHLSAVTQFCSSRVQLKIFYKKNKIDNFCYVSFSFYRAVKAGCLSPLLLLCHQDPKRFPEAALVGIQGAMKALHVSSGTEEAWRKIKKSSRALSKALWLVILSHLLLPLAAHGQKGEW